MRGESVSGPSAKTGMKTNRYMILTPKARNLRKALQVKDMTAKTTTMKTTMISPLLTPRKEARAPSRTTRMIMSFDRVITALNTKIPLRSI